ncbi:response regulator transcription factor [Salinimicrobium sp. TIG7-5_MAKvit]|uniref:LytR/AlgR family response regulator transcription factor n=1 Tax=Salinimicrobium sp. TIG7-5_MAKvit TaxID=3121289 RepID=UPI003C6E12B3
MSSIKIYILEDEIITQELLKQTLEELDFTICGMATNAETALAEIAILKPDIAILDIRVEGSQTGIWLGNQLDIPLIYLTAFNDVETIKKAIATKPTSYLVKPFNNKDLFIAVELAVSKIQTKAQIVVKDKDKKVILSEEQILFAKKEDQYLMLYLENSEKLIRSSIKDFLAQVNSSSFLQVHRSYIINKNCVTAFNTKEITIGNKSIPISKRYAKEVLGEISPS